MLDVRTVQPCLGLSPVSDIALVHHQRNVEDRVLQDAAAERLRVLAQKVPRQKSCRCCMCLTDPGVST